MALGKFILCTHCLTFVGVALIFLVRFGNELQCFHLWTSPAITNDIHGKTTFYGKWVKGQRQLKQTCDYINKSKCCKEKEKLRFVFDDATLNRVDPVLKMKKILRHHRVLFIGDKIMLELFDGVRELLKVREGTGSDRLNFLFAPQIYMNMSSSLLDLPDSLQEETLAEEVQKYDVIVFNQGLNYIDVSLELVAIHFHYIAQLLYKLTYQTTKQVRSLKVFARTTLHGRFTHKKKSTWPSIKGSYFLNYFYRPETKLRNGNIFTPVCNSVNVGGGVHPTRQTSEQIPILSRHPPRADPPGQISPGRPALADLAWQTPPCPPWADTPPADTPAPWTDTPLRDGHSTLRYASYWRAFSYIWFFMVRGFTE